MPSREGAEHRPPLQLPRVGVERKDIEVALSDQVIDAAGGPFVRQVHQGIARQAAAFAQIAELRLLFGAALHRARELRQREHRHVELAGQGFQAAADLRDLLDAVLVAAAAPAALHELQIVDDHQRKAVLHHQAARLAAHLHQRDGGRIVDVDVGLGETAHRIADALPLVVVQVARAQAALIHPGVHRKQARDELFLAHLQAEDGHALAEAQRRIMRQGERQGRVMYADVLGDEVGPVWHGQIIDLLLSDRLDRGNLIPKDIWTGESA